MKHRRMCSGRDGMKPGRKPSGQQKWQPLAINLHYPGNLHISVAAYSASRRSIQKFISSYETVVLGNRGKSDQRCTPPRGRGAGLPIRHGKAQHSTAKYSKGGNSALFRLILPTKESDCIRASALWSHSQRHDNLEEL